MTQPLPDPVEELLQVLGNVVEQNLDAVEIAHPDGTIVYANPAHEEVVGVSHYEAVGMSVFDFVRDAEKDEATDVVPEPRAAMVLATEELRVWRGRVPTAREPGRYHDVLLFPVRTADTEHVVVVRRDATDEVVARRALSRSERIIALGQVARVLGHEINNPLEVARLNLEALAERAEDDETRALVDEAREAVGRIIDRVADLRSVSTNRATNGATSVARAVDVARRSLTGRDPMIIRTEVDPSLLVLADRAALIRAITHLLNNALDAVRARSGAEIMVSARDIEGRVEITVRDNGPGLPADVDARVFEPFFTTKAPERHVGLGLTFARETARRLGGELTLSSGPDGLTATLTLCVGKSPARRGDGGRPRVLLVEDEAPLRRNYARWLRERFEVVGVGDSEEAMALLQKDPFDVVLCDVMLPGQNGVELFNAVCKERGLCDLWVFVTGGAPDEYVARALEKTGRPVLGKPVDWHELIRAVEAVVDAASHAA